MRKYYVFFYNDEKTSFSVTPHSEDLIFLQGKKYQIIRAKNKIEAVEKLRLPASSNIYPYHSA
jgi:hypothetical protein